MTVDLGSFDRTRAAQAEAQDHVNQTFDLDGAAAAAEIRVVATLAHAQYPQYHGRWDGDEWRLYRAQQNLGSKGGDQALAGDVVLGRPGAMVGEVEFYSVRLGWDCVGGYGLVQVWPR